MDDGDSATNEPTRKNILNAIKWLVKGAEPGDSLFMSYAGHGSQVVDVNGDEVNGWICMNDDCGHVARRSSYHMRVRSTLIRTTY
jgi:hypothetical protein